MRATSASGAKAKEAVARPARYRCSASSRGWLRLYEDAAKHLSSRPDADHKSQDNAGFRGLYRHLHDLRQSRRLRLPSSPDQSSTGLRGQRQPHQRHRELLEPGQAPPAQVQRHSKRHFHLFLKECEWRFNYGPPAKLFITLKAWIRRSSDNQRLGQPQK